jgi:hypothetical protein
MLGVNTYKSWSHSISGDKVIQTVLFTGTSIAFNAEINIAITYINGPILRVNLDKVTTDLVVKMKAKAAFKPVGTEEKTFIIKNIKVQTEATIKSNATEQKKPVFKVGTATDIEEFLDVTGPAVDVNLTGENAKWFTLKPRKSAALPFPLSSINNRLDDLQKFDNILVSVYNGNQLQFYYKPSATKPDGIESAFFPRETNGRVEEFSFYQAEADKLFGIVKMSNNNYYEVIECKIIKLGEDKV